MSRTRRKQRKRESDMMRSKNIVLTILMLCTAWTVTGAQTDNFAAVEDSMNLIKLDAAYVYGESYGTDRDLTLEGALKDLAFYCNEIRHEAGKDSLAVSNLMANVKELVYCRADKYTAFVYIPVEKMLSLTASRPNAGGTNSNTAQASHRPQPPRRPEPPRKPEKTEPPRKEEKPEPPVRNMQLAGTTLDELSRTLSTQDNLVEIKTFLSEFKKDGRVTATGATTQAAEVPADAYSILFDGMGGVLSVLSPMSAGPQMNYRTNLEDNQSNHSNCKFIIWYR